MSQEGHSPRNRGGRGSQETNKKDFDAYQKEE